MEYKEWSIDCRNKRIFPAKAQRRKGGSNTHPVSLLFAPLRLCGKYFLVLALLAITSFAQPRLPMRVADIVKVAGVTDAQMSPNGQWVVYAVSSIEDDQNVSTLWLARPTFGAPPIPTPRPSPRPPFPYADWPDLRSSPRLLLPGWNASSPRWSPDGSSIAFLSKHDDLEGLWVVKLDKPEPRFLAPITATNFFITYAGESISWSPDSHRLAYISATLERPETPADSKRSDDPRVIDRIQYKSRTSFSDNRRTHVWAVDIERPAPQQLTSGLFYDHAVSFSPRGDEIVFLSNREPDPDANNNSDIFAVDLGGQTRRLTETRGCEFDPIWSPDGKSIAYTATKRDVTTIDSVAEDSHLWVIPAAGGAGRELATDQDRRVRDARWSSDGRSILYLAGDRGYTTIFSVVVDSGRVSRFSLAVLDGQLAGSFEGQDSKERTESNSALAIAQPFQITSFSFANQVFTVSRGNNVYTAFPFVITMGNALRPPELWAGMPNVAPLTRLSGHNDSFVRSLRLVPPEEITFPSFDGTQIQGWLMRPPGCSSDRKCPLILSVHGGPHGMFGWSFNPAFQVYAARGYGVLYLNPRGSSGYGQKFSDGTINEWGGGDYRDLMAGVDEVLRRNSWVDGNRLGVTGGSYGGFMTNWIITQTPRFRGAVAVASLSNLISFYSTSLYQDLIHAEFGGFPWDNFDLLWQWSPLRYVRQVQTPTLFIHGENDNDVHITQAEEMYMALKRRGVDTVFVRYPREGHGLREPKHRVDALERTLNWFDRYVKLG
jgi:dipeptidyl aminopeptidase/acylaminoacyl peptidase